MGKELFPSVSQLIPVYNGMVVQKWKILYVLYASLTEHNAKDYQQTFQGYALLQRA